jgi:hypothetical protein
VCTSLSYSFHLQDKTVLCILLCPLPYPDVQDTFPHWLMQVCARLQQLHNLCIIQCEPSPAANVQTHLICQSHEPGCRGHP